MLGRENTLEVGGGVGSDALGIGGKANHAKAEMKDFLARKLREQEVAARQAQTDKELADAAGRAKRKAYYNAPVLTEVAPDALPADRIPEKRSGGRGSASVLRLAQHMGLLSYGSTLGASALFTVGSAAVAAGSMASSAVTGGFRLLHQTLHDITMEGLTAQASLHKLHRQTGESAHGMLALSHAVESTGGQSGVAEAGLKNLLGVIGEARHGGPAAAEALERLGTSAERLAGSKDKMRDVVEGLSKMADHGKRNQLAVRLLGSDIADLIPLLDKGAAGLDEAAVAASRLGKTSGDAEAASIAIKQLGDVATNVGGQIAVALSPVVLTLADDARDSNLSLANLNDTILLVARYAVYAGGSMYDAFLLPVSALMYFSRACKQAELGVVGLALAQARVTPLANGAVVGLEKWAAEIQDSIAANDAWIGALDSVTAKKSKVDRLFERAAKRPATQKAGHGWFDNLFGNAEQWKKIGSIIDQTRTPLEKLGDTLKNLDALFGSDNPEVYARAVGAALQQMEQAYNTQNARLPGAVLREGGAYSAVVKSEMESSLKFRENPQERVAKLLDEAREAEKIRREYLKIIAEAVKGKGKEFAPR